jgi:hypothetical protein
MTTTSEGAEGADELEMPTTSPDGVAPSEADDVMTENEVPNVGTGDTTVEKALRFGAMALASCEGPARELRSELRSLYHGTHPEYVVVPRAALSAPSAAPERGDEGWQHANAMSADVDRFAMLVDAIEGEATSDVGYAHERITRIQGLITAFYAKGHHPSAAPEARSGDTERLDCPRCTKPLGWHYAFTEPGGVRGNVWSCLTCEVNWRFVGEQWSAMPPESGEERECLLCSRRRPWGHFDSRTGTTVCVICRDGAMAASREALSASLPPSAPERIEAKHDLSDVMSDAHRMAHEFAVGVLTGTHVTIPREEYERLVSAIPSAPERGAETCAECGNEKADHWDDEGHAITTCAGYRATETADHA